MTTDSEKNPLDPLEVENFDPDPMKQFKAWMERAQQTSMTFPNPVGMTLATVSADGRPMARVVLLRGWEEEGFIFHTNYRSPKGKEIERNPIASLLLWWAELGRQVRIEGKIEKASAQISDEYFESRPRGNQLNAWASPQSEVIPSMARLEKNLEDVSEKYEGRDVPRPPHWGGYLLRPDMVEFWQQGADRFHDRIRYRKDEGGAWIIERLAP